MPASASSVYLDYNATCPIKPEVSAVMLEAMSTTGNPSSQHKFGRDARQIVERGREAISEVLSVRPSSVVFCSSGTEADNLALVQRDLKLTSAVEHPAILNASSAIEQVKVDCNGLIDFEDLDVQLSKTTGILSLQLVNSETGIIQPIAEVAARAKRAGWLVHSDAVQALGKLPFTFDELGVDLMTISAHKVGGPQGVAALIVKPGFDLRPLIKGGGQERNRRSGTENVAGIAGFGKAVTMVGEDLHKQSMLEKWRDAFEKHLVSESAAARIWGQSSPRVANTCAVMMANTKAETQLMAFDLAGFAVSAGSACSSGKAAASPVLSAMGANAEHANATIRVSLGWNSQEEDLQNFADVWLKQAAKSAVT